ncbi:MAG: hypothetical protein ACTHQM_21745 [Thermoanaerobaculia bacterium]
MRKLVLCEWDPDTKTVTVLDPLEGVASASELRVILPQDRPRGARVMHWTEFVGSLKGEAGDELAAVVEEMFPTQK